MEITPACHEPPCTMQKQAFQICYAVQASAMQCKSLPCSASLYHEVQASTMQCKPLPCSASLYHAVEASTMQWKPLPCSGSLYHAVQASTMQCKPSLFIKSLLSITASIYLVFTCNKEVECPKKYWFRQYLFS